MQSRLSVFWGSRVFLVLVSDPECAHVLSPRASGQIVVKLVSADSGEPLSN